MALNRKVKSKTLLAIAVLGLVAFSGTWISGWSLALNTSVSMPRGLYLVGPLGSIPKTGDIVALCIPNKEAAAVYLERDYLPASTRCATGISPVMKPVVGVPGDVMRVGQLSTMANGKQIPNSAVMDTDSQGLPIDHLPVGWIKRLDTDEYFMLANHVERSLDSRYYGTVQRSDMLALAHPLITF